MKVVERRATDGVGDRAHRDIPFSSLLSSPPHAPPQAPMVCINKPKANISIAGYQGVIATNMAKRLVGTQVHVC